MSEATQKKSECMRERVYVKSDAASHIFCFYSIHIPMKEKFTLAIMCHVRGNPHLGSVLFSHRVNLRKKKNEKIIINMSSYLPAFYLPTFPYTSCMLFLSPSILLISLLRCCFHCQMTMKS